MIVYILFLSKIRDTFSVDMSYWNKEGTPKRHNIIVPYTTFSWFIPSVSTNLTCWSLTSLCMNTTFHCCCWCRMSSEDEDDEFEVGTPSVTSSTSATSMEVRNAVISPVWNVCFPYIWFGKLFLKLLHLLSLPVWRWR